MTAKTASAIRPTMTSAEIMTAKHDIGESWLGPSASRDTNASIQVRQNGSAVLFYYDTNARCCKSSTGVDKGRELR